MEPRTRTLLFWVGIGVAILAILSAVVSVVAAPETSPTVILVAFVVVVVVLAGEIALLVLGGGEKFDKEGEWRDWQEKTQAAGRELILRCSTCGNTFPVVDSGERPLRHACPHCGRVGVLRDEPAPPGPAGTGP